MSPTSPPAPVPPSARQVIGDRRVRTFLVAQATSTIAVTLQAAALAKHVYDITDSEFALGLLGLVEFMPALLLLPLTGSVADRFDRRRVAAVAFTLEIGVSVLLCVYATTSPTSAVPIFGLAALFGVVRAFGVPAMRSIPPLIAPAGGLPRLIALYSATWQIGMIVGPASSGLLYDVDPAAPYAAAAIAAGLGAIATLAIRYRRPQERTPSDQAPTLHHALEGLRFIRSRPILLGAISLDLFAVLFGGAMALLPAIAEDRLHVGNIGYGWLRAAPGVGAVIVSALLAIRPVRRRVGTVLFVAVGVFGAMTIVLGVTTTYVVAFLALVVLAAADSISVFVRATLVPLATPDHMRGRVSAVENVFIGASNELGAFESGVAAALLGVGPAVVLGGVATMAVAALWTQWFPELRRVDTFDDATVADHASPSKMEASPEG
ncbi:MAG TPA: MFS transporter, partial [Desertimonas sp.]|nr:MFS transporter [Desertimonas sp.]